MSFSEIKPSGGMVSWLPFPDFTELTFPPAWLTEAGGSSSFMIHWSSAQTDSAGVRKQMWSRIPITLVRKNPTVCGCQTFTVGV